MTAAEGYDVLTLNVSPVAPQVAHLWSVAAVLAVASLGLLAARRPLPPVLRGRRRWVRRGGRPVLVEVRGLAGGSVCGCVLDRSPTGLRLRVERPAVVGSAIGLAARHASAGTPAIAAEVRWCSRVGDAYEVGCRFAAELPPSVLVLFG